MKNVWDKNPKDSYGRTPLHFAAANGHTYIWEMILAVAEDKNPKNRYGFTPLHLAAKGDHKDIVEILASKIKNKNSEIDHEKRDKMEDEITTKKQKFN